MHDHAQHTSFCSTAAATSSRLRVAFVLTVAILFVEIAGGFVSNSLALLSDAGHLLTDVLALGIAWFASHQAERPATGTKTFGFHRAGILAALVNAITLVAIAVFILWEAYNRFRNPEPVQSGIMLGVAFVGLVVNIVVVRYLQGNESENLNVRGAVLHVAGDALASAAVVAGGVAMFVAGGWYFLDPVLSVLIAAIIAFSSRSIIAEAINILMEGVPKGVDLEMLRADLREVTGVEDVHDVHVWSLAAGLHALSCHITVCDQAISESDVIMHSVNDLLGCKYGINHTTIQLEHVECGIVCKLFDTRVPAGSH